MLHPWGGTVLCLASLAMVLVYPKPDKVPKPINQPIQQSARLLPIHRNDPPTQPPDNTRHPTPQPTPTLGYTVAVMGAGGGVLLASRHLLAAASTSKPAATALATLQLPPPFSSRVLLRVAVGLAALIAVKELTKPLILAALRPFLPPAHLRRQQESLVDVGKGKGNKGKQQAGPGSSEWQMAPAEVLAKYLNYFAVGAAVVYPIPLLWAALGL